MEQSKSKIILISLVIAVVALVAGFYVGQQAESNKSESKIKVSQDNMLKEIFSHETISGNGKIDSLSGKIQSISSDKKAITVEISDPVPGVAFPTAYKTKNIIIDKNTQILTIVKKPKDMEDIEGNYMGKIITTDDLKIGDQISLTFSVSKGESILDNQILAIGINIVSDLFQSATLIESSTSTIKQ